MAISKVTLNGVTLMDVTSDTVEASNLLSGNTATKNDGTKVTGSYTPVAPMYQEKTISPTTSVQVVTPDTTYDALSQVTVNAMSLTEKTVTPSSQVQIVTAGTEMVENLIGFSGTSEGSYTNLTITKNGETIGQTYTTDGRTHTVIYDEDAGKQYKVWFRIKKWFFGPTSDYEYGTPVEFEVIDTFYSNGNYKDIIIPVNDPDGVVTSIRVNRETYYNIRLIFSGGSSIPSGKNYIKYASNIYSVEEAHYDALSQVTVNAIPSEYVVPTGTLAISQNGTVNVKNYEYANVNVSGGGSVTVDNTLPVRFLDYDGTVVASYTAEDFANLSAMPPNPSRTGLTAQGWNWTLADAKEQVAEMGACDIGQMYITDDGKTRIYCHFTEGALSPYLGIGVKGTVVVDWGDNSTTDTLTGTSLTTATNVQHIYASEGDYLITLTVSSGSFSLFGVSSGTHLLRKSGTSISSNTSAVYSNAVRKIELGSNANIGNYALNNCQSLTDITIPSGITAIGNNAFYKCYSLETITIPSGVTTIGSSAFNYCMGLVSISIPNRITIIGSSVFSSCYSLRSIVIPSGVTTIGSNALYACYSLTDITIPSSVTTIGSSAFGNSYCLATITIPSGVTTISNSAFYSCNSLRNIVIPSGVTAIGSTEFYNCYSLRSIAIPSGVTTIGDSAFYNCYCLATITIPSGVTTIGSNAFKGLYGVSEYHLLSTTPPSLGTTAFDGIQSDCVIYVPSASLEAYQTVTNWSTYASYMVGE